MARGGNVDVRNIAAKNGSFVSYKILYALNRGGRKQGGKYEGSDGVHNKVGGGIWMKEPYFEAQGGKI